MNWYIKQAQSQPIQNQDVIWLDGLCKKAVVIGEKPREVVGRKWWTVEMEDETIRKVPEEYMKILVSPKSHPNYEKAVSLISEIFSGKFREYKVPLFHPDKEPMGFLVSNVSENIDNDDIEDTIEKFLLEKGWTQQVYKDNGGGGYELV